METLLSIVIGGLYTAGFYSILRRSIVKLVIGLMFISHATNLLIFTAGGLTRGLPPLVASHRQVPDVPFADPLPQALTLTAIVISFGITAFTLVLVLKAFKTTGTDDLDEMKGSES